MARNPDASRSFAGRASDAPVPHGLADRDGSSGSADRPRAGAIDLAAIAAAADQHLSAATRTHEQPGWRFHQRRLARTWTASAMLGIMPQHACSARCGARRRSGLGGLGRRRACQSAGCHRASLRPSTPSCCAARARLWICGQRKSVAHIPTGPTINNKHQFDRFRRLGSDPARHIQPTVSPGSDDASTMTRAHLSADLDSHSQGAQSCKHRLSQERQRLSRCRER